MRYSNQIKSAFTLLIGLLATAGPLAAQSDQVVKKQLQLTPQSADTTAPFFRLLPIEEQQETGNAVPVLLRITYERNYFMTSTYPRLHEYAEMDIADPELNELWYDSFAREIIRAGSMSFADWEYPLYSERPYGVLLPDMQSQRQLVGHGMTAWIKQRLAAAEVSQALKGIRAQIACGKHCAETPVLVCQLIGLSLANSGFDNLELAIQRDNVPNLYWSLAVLPPTLQDPGKTVRWDMWAAPTRIDEPLPAIGSDAWLDIASEFTEIANEWMGQQYTKQEAETLKNNLEQLAKTDLIEKLNFTAEDIANMSTEERIMRWLYLEYCNFRAHVEPLAHQKPKEVIAAKLKVEARNANLLEKTGAKESPLPIILPHGILACRNFERRVKFLQTIEALRDYTNKHDGDFPASLESLELTAPNDPFTEQPFEYELTESGANLRQALIEGWEGTTYDYELTVAK